MSRRFGYDALGGVHESLPHRCALVDLIDAMTFLFGRFPLGFLAGFLAAVAFLAGER